AAALAAVGGLRQDSRRRLSAPRPGRRRSTAQGRLRRRRRLLRRQDARDRQPVQGRPVARSRCRQLGVAQSMKVLVVGSGGREHALAWRLRQDDPTVEILAAPGNPGIAELGRCIPVAATDVGALVTLARETQAAWTLVGPEAALDAGIADAFRAANLPIFGPTRAAAQLESSKAFAKSVMETADVPTARALRASSLAEARRAIDEL